MSRLSYVVVSTNWTVDRIDQFSLTQYRHYRQAFREKQEYWRLEVESKNGMWR
jgi:hypothetical protein